MADMNDWKIIGPILAGLVGLYGFVLKHLSNTDRHTDKKDIVYKDVCKAERNRLEDCIEGTMNLLNERTASIEKAVNAANKTTTKSIDEVKDLLDKLLDR